MTATRCALLYGLVLAATGCRVHGVDSEPSPPFEIPESYGAASQHEPGAGRWWETFQDQDLDGLVERSLGANLDLRAAWARLEQSEAVARKSRAELFPFVSLGADAGRSQRTFEVGGPIGTVTTESNDFMLSLAAAYEVDLWGRVRSQVDAAELDVLATRADVEAGAMTLAARVAETWFLLVEARAQHRLLEEQRNVSRTYVELLELRFAQAQASALDVFQQRQQAGAIEAEIPLADAAEAAFGNQLAILVGVPPEEFTPPAREDLPSLPPLPPLERPADLIIRRPDIRRARQQVVAADHRVGAAIADLLPALRLSGQGGFQATQLSNLFESWMYSVLGSLTAPVFEGGRRRAEVARARAVLKERLQLFGQALLTAFAEVEDAFVSEHRQVEHLAALDRQLEIARSSLREAGNRYAHGLDSYLSVLIALQAYQDLQRRRLRAAREVLVFRVQLSRALGGPWTHDLSPPSDVALEEGSE